MDNKKINQLMDEGWKKLSVSLDTELPIKKERKLLVYWWSISAAILISLGYMGYKVFYTQEANHVEKFSLNKNNPSINVTKDKGDIIEDNNKFSAIDDSKKDQMSAETNVFAANENPETITKINPTLHQSFNTSDKSGTGTQKKYGDDVNSLKYKTGKNSNETEVNKEITSTGFHAKTATQTEIKTEELYVQNQIRTPLILDNLVTQIIPINSVNFSTISIKPKHISDNNNKMSYGFAASAAFNNLDAPGNIKFGLFAQKPISKKWTVELGLHLQRYGEYQTIHHNGKNIQNILYQDAQLASGFPSGRVLNSVYVNNSKLLTINQLSIFDESILASSVSALHFINTEINMLYHGRNLSLVAGLNIGRKIDSRYNINDVNTEQYNALNNMPLTLSTLKSGDQLLRNWLYACNLGFQYTINKKLAVRSNFVYTPMIYQSPLNKDVSREMSGTSSVSLDKVSEISRLVSPEKANFSLEFGIKYLFKQL